MSGKLTGPDATTHGAAGRAALLAFALAAAYHGWLEFSVEHLRGRDAYYHLKLASLYWTGGCPILGGDFPWMQHATFNGLRHDWQLLYHLLLIPFTALGRRLGGKLAVVVAAALLVAVLHLVLRRHRVPRAWFFSTMVAVMCVPLTHRLHLVRPTPLAMALLLLLLDALLRRRAWQAFVWAALSLCVYNVPHSVLLLGTAATLPLLLQRQSGGRRGAAAAPLLAAVGGATALATLLHPGFWHWQGSFLGPHHANFQLWRLMAFTLEAARHGFQVTTAAGGLLPLPAAAEFLPPLWAEVRHGMPLALAVAAATAILTLTRWRRLRPETWTVLLAAAAYAVLFLRFARFVEYCVPLLALAAGLVLRDASGPPMGMGPGAGVGKRGGWALAAGATLLLSLTGHGVHQTAVSQATLDAPSLATSARLAAPMRWLRQNSAAGDTVLHTRWADFSPMFGFNHHNHYIVGLDPSFLYLHDTDEYRLWWEARHDGDALLRAMDGLGAPLLLATADDPSFREMARAEPRLEVIYEDAWTTVLRRALR